MTLWGNLEARRQEVERVIENSTRPARAFATYTTTGQGSFVETRVIPFRTSFIVRPTFTFGFSLSDDTRMPTDPPACTAGVHDWQRTANGNYVGAYCWYTVVTTDDIDPPSDLTVIFHLAWEGLASKDFLSTPGFPVNLLDA